MTLTPEQLDEMEARAKAATPGPRTAEQFWRQGDDHSKPSNRWRIFLLGADNPRTNSRDCDWTEGDARHIAAMDRETVVDLVAVYRAALAWSDQRDYEHGTFSSRCTTADKADAPLTDR